jgi:ABC-type nitrate/sulfonate/bicarbonate transport system permease component
VKLSQFSALGQLAALIAFLGLWQLAASLRWMDPRLLPAPAAVWTVMWGLLQQPGTQRDLAVTGLEVIVAMAVAVPLAIGAGMVLAEGVSGEFLRPLANLGMAVPQSIFLPIFLMVLGNGLLEKVIFGLTHAFFVIALNSAAAVRSVPAPLIRMAEMYGANKVDLQRKIYYPCMMPVILQGVRLGLIFCVTGVVLAEMYVSKVGIGHDIVLWGSSFDLPRLLAGIFIVGVGTMLANQALYVLERYTSRWRLA